MNELVERLAEVEAKTSQKMGEYSLFALVMPEEGPAIWDLVVSASWLGRPGRDSVERIGKVVRDHLDETQIRALSRVVVLEPDHELVRRFVSLGLRHGLKHLEGIDLAGLPYQSVVVLTAQELPLDVEGAQKVPTA